MSWFEGLRGEAGGIWEAIHAHPFVTELGAGTLARERFRAYMLQDHPYLKEFARVLAMAVTRGGAAEAMAFFADLLHATLHLEMPMQLDLCAEMGITAQEIRREALSPTAYAYTRHLLATGSLGTQAEMAAALAPCIVSYAEIGRRLGEKPPPGVPLYARWIEAYASEPYQQIAGRSIQLLDDLERGVGPEERDRCRAHFQISSRYEWMFWEMAYRGESWPPAVLG